MANTPKHLSRLAKSQDKTPEELVESALLEGKNPHAAAQILGVSSDTVYHFMSVRKWRLASCVIVVKPELETKSAS